MLGQVTALICSAGMGLPVSGFPNLMAVNLEDEVGNRYLSVNDFLKAGVRYHVTNSGEYTDVSVDSGISPGYGRDHHDWLFVSLI